MHPQQNAGWSLVECSEDQCDERNHCYANRQHERLVVTWQRLVRPHRTFIRPPTAIRSAGEPNPEDYQRQPDDPPPAGYPKLGKELDDRKARSDQSERGPDPRQERALVGE